MAAKCYIPLKLKFKVPTEGHLPVPKSCETCPFQATSSLLFLRHHCVRNYARHIQNSQLLSQKTRDFAEENGVLRCQWCYYQSKRADHIESHVRGHLVDVPERRYQCDNCDYTSNRKSTLTKHFLRKHTKDWIQCQRCDYKTKVNADYETHKRKKHPQDPHVTCKVCGVKYEPEALKTHMTLVHPGVLECHKCRICAKSFRWPYSLRRHIQKEHTAIEHQRWIHCDYCDYKTLSQQQIQNHVIARHKTDEATWQQCPSCPYRSLNVSNLKGHILRKHTPDEDIEWFHCAYCDHKAKTKYYLKVHIQNMHYKNKNCIYCAANAKEGEPPPTCRSCDFFEKKLEKKAQDYTCCTCQRSFKSHASLKKHVQREHTSAEDIKWIKCERCDYKTLVKQKLVLHVRAKHTKKDSEWEHCPFCEFKSPYRTSIKMHVLRKHTKDEDVVWYRCESCDFKSKAKSDLVVHVQNVHKKTCK